MIIFPAIDIYERKAVRLYQGDYAKMTIYEENLEKLVADFQEKGCKQMHLVDLEGAKDGEPRNIDSIRQISRNKDMFVQVGGGIRNMDSVKRYLDAGVDRVILGTAALYNRAFLEEALHAYAEAIAVSVDIKNRKVAVKGWTEKSDVDVLDFCQDLTRLGVQTMVATDISKDGAMQGPNIALYEELNEKFPIQWIASGGVSSIEDIKKLRAIPLYASIIGKAYYSGAIDLEEAVEVAK